MASDDSSWMALGVRRTHSALRPRRYPLRSSKLVCASLNLWYHLPHALRFRFSVCHTPKFSLHLLKTFHTSMLKDFSRVDQTNSLLDNQPKLGFGVSQIKMDFRHLQEIGRASCR